LELVLAPAGRERPLPEDLEAAQDSGLAVAKVRAAAPVVVRDLVKVWAAESALAERARAESELVRVDRVSEDRELGSAAEDFLEWGRARVRVLVRDLVLVRDGELAKGQSTFLRSKNRTFRDC
jgi:hypothetical protein